MSLPTPLSPVIRIFASERAAQITERARERPLVQGMLVHCAGQLPRRRPVERAERDRRQQIVALEVTEHPFERGIVLLFLRPHGADHEAARRPGDRRL